MSLGNGDPSVTDLDNSDNLLAEHVRNRSASEDNEAYASYTHIRTSPGNYVGNESSNNEHMMLRPRVCG